MQKNYNNKPKWFNPWDGKTTRGSPTRYYITYKATIIKTVCCQCTQTQKTNDLNSNSKTQPRHENSMKEKMAYSIIGVGTTEFPS